MWHWVEIYMSKGKIAVSHFFIEIVSGLWRFGRILVLKLSSSYNKPYTGLASTKRKRKRKKKLTHVLLPQVFLYLQ
jgi:hypothetical protein